MSSFCSTFYADNLYIPKLILAKIDDMQERAYINVSGTAINCNKTGGFFEVNVPQYTSQYKANCTLSILPVDVHFNSNKYKTKKPILSNNTYVSIKGFLDNIKTDISGRATAFHISIDNINFLSKAMLSPSSSGNTGHFFKSSFVFIFNTFTQPPPHLHAHPALSSTLMPLLQAHQLTPPSLIRSLQQLSPNMVYWHKEEKKENKLHIFVQYK